MSNENSIHQIREGEAKIDFISRLYQTFGHYAYSVDIVRGIRAGRSDDEIINMLLDTYADEKALEHHSLDALGTPGYGG